MTQHLQWFRMYHRIVDDEKVRLLAFEDRWHFVALCALKCSGLLDEAESEVKWRKVSLKMGIQTRELDEVKRRLFEVGLVDENMLPLAWDELQYHSDNSTGRVQKYREKTRTSKAKRAGNVSVTGQETDTEADTEPEVREKEKANAFSKKLRSDPTDGLSSRRELHRDDPLFQAIVRLRDNKAPPTDRNGNWTFDAAEVARAEASLAAAA